MGRGSLPSALLLPFLLVLSSCGGGSSSSTLPPPPPPPPPPAADFSLAVNTSAEILQQGGAFQFQTVQANPLNGFTGTISLSLSGLPSGVTTTPTGPFTINLASSPQSASFQLVALASAPTGTATVTVTGTSGNITHSKTFSLTVSQAAPFAIQVSPASVSLKPASVATVQISVSTNSATPPQLGVTVSGPPGSSQVNLSTPQGFLTPSNPLSFTITATDLAQPLQNFPVLITASDNSANASVVILPLTVLMTFSSNTTPTRSTFSRTDKSPTGMVYDPFRKLLFVSVEILNEVVVLSSVDGHEVASIPVSFPAGIDEAADGSAVYVVSPYFGGVTIIDPNLLQVIGHSDVPSSVSGLSQSVTFFQVAALSNGSVMFYPTFDTLDLTGPAFYLWDPKANTFVHFGPASFSTASVLMSRSADHSKLIATGGTTGGILYDANTNSFIGPNSIISGAYAINPNGSQLASAIYQNGVPVFAFYDSNFNLLGTLPFDAFWNTGPRLRLFYSRDGKYLYIVPDQSIGQCNPCGAVAVVDATTFSVVGLVPTFSFGAALPFSGQWITTFDVDETNMLFGAVGVGVGFLDLNSPTFLQEPMPGFFLVQPSLASLSSPTQAKLNGVGFSQGPPWNLFIGPPPSSSQSLKATNVTVQSDNFLNLTIPARTAPGPANATLTRSDGFFEVMPDGISYGPTILRVDADAGSPSGGDSIIIHGYGLSVPGTQVSIGGKSATIVQQSSAIVGQFLPTESIKLTTPSGAGMADVIIDTPTGSTTIPKGFQYLNSVQVHPVAGALDALVYDQPRQRLYLSNQDHNRVEVFDLGTNTYLAPVSVGNAPTSIALTPDAQLLAVENSADGTASVIDAVKMQVVATYPLLTAADLNKVACAGVITQISPVAPHRMLAAVNCTAILQGEGGLSHLINLDTGSLSCAGVVGCASNGTDLSPAAPVMASTPDGAKVFFAACNVGLLDFTANTLTTAPALSCYADTAVSADGTTFAAAFGTYDAQLAHITIMAFEPYADSGSQSFHNVIGEKLNPSGSLLFFPQDSGVDIFDVHTGRLVRHVVLPDPIPIDTNGMVLDETGTRMFLISKTGVTIASLLQAPLGLGTVKPAAGPSGTTVVLRGSGFQQGASVTFGTVQVPAAWKDSNTLQATVPALQPGPVRVAITNPDGSQYSLDAAYIVQ